jgi:hypothetical protein
MPAKPALTPPWKAKKKKARKARAPRGRKQLGLTETEKLQKIESTSPHTKAQLETFLASYIIDFTMSKTMSRLGFQGTDAAIYRSSNEMYWHPYTQQRLAEYLSDVREDAIASRAQVVARLWEECNDRESKASDRIAALGKLAKIKGMEVTNIKVEAAPVQGVLVMPMADGVDGWEKASEAAQRELIAKVKGIGASRSN